MRLYRRFLFFFLSVGLLLTSCGVGRSLRQAEQSYARGEYFDAARHYKTAYTRTSPKDRSQRGVLAYKQGDCYRRINYTLKAKGAYMNAVRQRVKYIVLPSDEKEQAPSSNSLFTSEASGSGFCHCFFSFRFE